MMYIVSHQGFHDVYSQSLGVHDVYSQSAGVPGCI